MCKFQKPQISAEATADERRSIMFEALKQLDLSDKTEKRDALSYISWSNAWGEFKSAYPTATYSVKKNANGLPFFVDDRIGVFVMTSVTADEVTHEMWLPVLDTKNKAQKLESYNYQVYDNYKRAYVEKTVAAVTSFDVNRALMRCLTKNLAMFGLGLYLYAGEDFPEKTTEDTAQINQQPQVQQKTATKTTTSQPANPFAPIMNAINSMNNIQSLTNLYLDHQNEVEGNPEIKALFTQRRQQLQYNGGRKNG